MRIPGALVAGVALVAAACAGTSSPPATTVAPVSTMAGSASPCRGAPPGSYDHVVWIWMENHSSALRSPSAAYERALAGQCGLGTDDHAVGSPSLPNYLGATSGDTWGVSDDAGPGSHRLAVDNLFRQVRASGRQERSFEEAMPGPCALAGSGRYAVKHNPAAYYVGPGDRAACQADDVALGGLDQGAFADAIRQGTLPAFSFVTPDLCHDTHDCGIGSGDAWLAQWVPRLLAGPNYRAGDTAVFVVWDEPTPMSLIVVAPSVRPGTVVKAPTSHYGLLRATEELLGLPLLGRAASATSLRSLFAL